MSNQSGHTTRSRQLYERAERCIVGGVNSPSRSFAGVGGGAPLFMSRGEGAYLYDVDGNRYIDYLAAFGALILGHAHPGVLQAVQAAAERGTVYGTCTPAEIELAERLKVAVPQLEKVRFTASGTEAVMTAIRIARGVTGRSRIVKFDGSYHGHSDLVLVAAGSGSSTLGLSESAGIPPTVFSEVISLPYNDPDAVRNTFQAHGSEIAAILVEPIVGNFGIVPPESGFLQTLREVSRQAGTLLICDEVLTAFRYGYGSVLPRYEIEADLITMGKIIGGGVAIGAYGGPSHIVDWVSPIGPVYQNGTWAGNPLAMAAGVACLDVLAQEPQLYTRLDRHAKILEEEILAAAKKTGHPVHINREGGAFAVYFTEETTVRDFAAVERMSNEKFGKFFRLMLEEGVCLPPSKYEAWFVSAAHTEADIAQTIEAVERVFRRLPY